MKSWKGWVSIGVAVGWVLWLTAAVPAQANGGMGETVHGTAKVWVEGIDGSPTARTQRGVGRRRRWLWALWVGRGRRRKGRRGRQPVAPESTTGGGDGLMQRVVVLKRTVAARSDTDGDLAGVDSDAGLHAWVAQELGDAALGDARLNRRLLDVEERLMRRPGASIPEACGEWASTKATYRFLDNDKVAREAILEPHRQATLRRMAHEQRVLVVQDTPSLNFSQHPATQGLGPLENEHVRGMLVHSALVVSEAGVPLGLLDQQVWTRDAAQTGHRHQRKALPIEQKESFKWLQGLKASLRGLPTDVVVVTVADREADVFDLFHSAHARHAEVLVRACRNRKLTSGDYLYDAVRQTEVRGHYLVEVGRGGERVPRTANVAVRYAPVTVKPPRYRSHEPGLAPVPLWAVEVREDDPPAGVKQPLHWLLLINRPVTSLTQAREVARWYGLRWLVERYHFVLKTGCRIEQRQLQTTERLERCLGVYAIVAWRLLWISYHARVQPQAPCSVVLEPHEWQALYCYIHRTPIPPDEPPTLWQAVRWIAQLGGFLGRKHDGEPGVQVLWRGLQRLNDIAPAFQIFHPPPDVGKA